jgi:Arc/MetJ-type ribon-helix-helix transcriptional regulator
LTGNVESEITTIHLPKELADRIQRRLKESDFKNMDEYVAYVLSQIMDEIEGNSSPKSEDVFTKKEQGDVEEHLRSLGYM